MNPSLQATLVGTDQGHLVDLRVAKFGRPDKGKAIAGRTGDQVERHPGSKLTDQALGISSKLLGHQTFLTRDFSVHQEKQVEATGTWVGPHNSNHLASSQTSADREDLFRVKNLIV